MNTKKKTHLLPALLVLIVSGVAAAGMLVQAKSLFLVDNTDSGYMEEGNWKTVRRIGYRKNERVGESTGSTTAQAQWTFTGIPRGSYDVFATWQVADSAKSEPDTEAIFTIENGEKHLASISVNQEENSTGSRYKNVWWQKLGTWDVRNPQVTIHLSPSTHSRSIFADAILLRRHKEQAVRGAPSLQVPPPLVSTGSRVVPPILRPSTGARPTPSPVTSGAASGNAPAVPSTPGAPPTANSSTPSTPPSSPTGTHPTLTGTGSVSSASGSRVSSLSSAANGFGFSWIKVEDITTVSAKISWGATMPFYNGDMSLLEYSSPTTFNGGTGVRHIVGTEGYFVASEEGRRLWPGTTYYFRIMIEDRNGNIARSNEQTFQTLPAPISANTSLSVERRFPGQYDNTKYSIILKDPDGVRQFLVEKLDKTTPLKHYGNSTSIWGGSGWCTNPSMASDTVTLEPSDFPLMARVEDCPGNFAKVQVDSPPPIGETASSSSATTTSSSASPSGDTSFAVNRVSGTSNGYTFIVTPSTAGLDTFLVKRADGVQVFGGLSYYCQKTPATTQTVSLDPSAFPLTATVTACGGITSTFTVNQP